MMTPKGQICDDTQRKPLLAGIEANLPQDRWSHARAFFCILPFPLYYHSIRMNKRLPFSLIKSDAGLEIDFIKSCHLYKRLNRKLKKNTNISVVLWYTYGDNMIRIFFNWFSPGITPFLISFPPKIQLFPSLKYKFLYELPWH